MASVLIGSCSFCGSSPAISSHHKDPSEPRMGRREVVLRTSEIATLGAIFHFSGTKPNYLGLQKNPPSLALCPATNNCISTSEEIADVNHYAPPWNYNPQKGLRKKPVSKEEAMRELLQVVESTKPDNFKPGIVEKKDDYIRVEYESPIMGFVDDAEFWFPPGNKSVVQYRSASRLGNFDFFDINRKRIKVEKGTPVSVGEEGMGLRDQLLVPFSGSAHRYGYNNTGEMNAVGERSFTHPLLEPRSCLVLSPWNQKQAKSSE